MPSPIAKAHRDHLSAFLKSHGDFWAVEAFQSFEEFVTHSPMSTDELIGAICAYAPQTEYVYVFSDDDAPFELVNIHGIDAAPTIDAKGLEDFAIRSGRGNDFLRISPDDEDAANGTYLTLLPCESPEVDIPIPRRRGPILKGMSIANFKGVGDRVDINFAPITLLFGANSAGKSTIIHALHYAREILVRRNFDVDRAEIGGTQVELGGFKNLVHKHNDDGAVRLRFELDLRGIDLPDYLPNRDDLLPNDANILDSHVAVESATVEFHVWNDAGESPPYVCHYEVAINGRPLATIFQGWHDQAIDFHFEMDHPLIQDGEWLDAVDEESDHEFSPEFGWLRYWPIDEWMKLQHRATENVWQGRIDTKITTDGDALPAWGTLLNIALPDLDFGHLEEVTGLHDDDEATKDRLVKTYEVIPLLFRDYLTRLILGPCEVLKNILSDFRYVGPIRETPPRSFSPPRFPDAGRWANGLGAWDELYRNAELRERVSEWLSSPDRLGTGYSVLLRQYREIDENGPLMQAITSGRAYDDIDNIQKEFERLPFRRELALECEETRLSPYDVGIGISQVVPVVALALNLRGGLAAIEQPELHVHPSVQVGLGDLFIEAIQSSRNLFLIETHSEHLLLRLLRRIKEQSDRPTAGKDATLRPDDLAVLFVDRNQKQTRIRNMPVNARGDFAGFWPEGFFDERAKEIF